MDVHEDFPLNVPKVIVDVSLFIHIYIYIYVYSDYKSTRWKADSIFALGHK